VNDFWYMVWQEIPSAIVMVTRAVESGKVGFRKNTYFMGVFYNYFSLLFLIIVFSKLKFQILNMFLYNCEFEIVEQM